MVNKRGELGEEKKQLTGPPPLSFCSPCRLPLLWLLSNAVFHADHATNGELAKNIRTWETSYVAKLRKSHPRTVTERHAQVLEEHPEPGPIVEFLEFDYAAWFRASSAR